MNHNNKQYQLISEALTLQPEERQEFVSQIHDPALKEQVTQLLNDETALTQYLIQTAIPESVQKTPMANDGIEENRLHRITIQKLLGQGGMGSVYLGFDEKLRRKVAIKSIRPEYLSMTSTQQRFVREARILSKINHPSICHIYDYIETPNGDYLVLEYIEGQELYKVNLSEARILDVLLDLCHALAAAHQHEIVHRDLKPDNIMMTRAGDVKVLDFGIARSITSSDQTVQQPQRSIDDNLTQHGSLVGTIRYMSPEQARGEQLTAASDMYSLGIIAQELFSGTAAYEIRPTEQLLEDVQQGKRQAAPNLPAPINQLIQQLTDVVPENRPSAQQTAEVIEKIQSAPQRKRKKRNQVLAGILISTLVVLLLWQWQQYVAQQNSADLTKSYTESIQELVRSSEQIYVLPIHDVTPGINDLLNQAMLLFGEISQDPGLNTEDKLRLQGLIYTEAEEYELAVTTLEKIESKNPADNSLLARAWTGFYIDVMTEYSNSYGIAEALQSEDMKKNYLQPTLQYIDASTTKDPVEQAFKVSQTESLESAVVLLDEIINQQRWNKKAIQLKSQILMAQAIQSLEAGQWDDANNYYQNTATTYEQAIEMARSYPLNYLNLCHVRGLLMVDGIQRTGASVQEQANSALTACQNYLVTSPSDDSAMNNLARIYMMLAQWHLSTGVDATLALQQARQWNRESLSINISLDNVWTQALIETVASVQAMLTGLDPKPLFERAQKAFDQAKNLTATPQPHLDSDRLYTYALRVELEHKQGINFKPTVEQAEKLYADATSNPHLLASEKRPLLINMGAVYYAQLYGMYHQGHDITPLAQELIALYSEGRNELVREPNLFISLANTHLLLAEYNYQNARPLEQDLSAANAWLQQAFEINQTSFSIFLTQAKIQTLTTATSHHDFSNANTLYQKALDTNPSAPIHHAWAESYVLQAQLASSKDLRAEKISQGLEQIQAALAIDAENAIFLETLSKLKTMQETAP